MPGTRALPESDPTMADDVRRALREYILTSFLPGEAPESLEDSTLLVTSGIITSLSMLELVTFIEETFDVMLLPEDLGVAHMDSVDLLVELVARRRRGTRDPGGASG
jgi:acyl carrier protein